MRDLRLVIHRDQHTKGWSSERVSLRVDGGAGDIVFEEIDKWVMNLPQRLCFERNVLMPEDGISSAEPGCSRSLCL